MRIKTFNNGGYITEGFSSLGGTLTGPLILSRNPIEDLEAATKQYADQNLNSFDADNIGTGTLQAGRLPAFTGDVVSNAGNANISLLNSGVSSGIYPKVTVNSKGIVVNGSGLISTDVPNLDWSKVTTGKPTTLDGYGIADAITTSGGTMNGSLVLNSDPVDPLHAVTKQYAEETINNGINFNSGDIVRLSTDVAPSGFLRCNGGELVKADYSTLYAIVGDQYAFNIQIGRGQPWKQQSQINTEQTDDISGWVEDGSLPSTVHVAQAIVTKNRVYLLGGYNSSTVYTAPINSDGTLGTWATGTSLPVTISNSQVIVIKNRVYLLGGIIGSVASSAIYMSTIDNDGILGSWSLTGNLPSTITNSSAIVTGNRIYLLGGAIDGTQSSIVYTTTINSDGTLGPWSTGISLPQTVHSSQVIVTKNRVYLVSGTVNNTQGNSIFHCPINFDGTLGGWVTINSIGFYVTSAQCFVTDNRAYVIGGEGSSGGTSVYTAPVNVDGTLGTWVAGSTLPVSIDKSQLVVTKNKIYLISGFSGNYIYTASISGGVNDYSPYYDGTFTPTDSTKFKLPDLSTKELQGTYSYIKI